MRQIAVLDERTPITTQSAGETATITTVTVSATGVALTAVERSLIQYALDVHQGNRTRAAVFLRLSRSALLYRMQKYHLDSSGARVPGHRQS